MLKSKLNLTNYEKISKSFLWKNYYDELSWFPGGKINAAFNATDRHLTTFRKNKIALYWESEDNQSKKFTFEELSKISSQFGNYFKKIGVKKGDRVFIFLPRIPQVYFSFLGALKIGAVGGTLFPAFGEQGLFDRLSNSGAKVLVTNKELKPRVLSIAKKLKNLKTIVVVDDPIFEKKIEETSSKLKIAEMDPKDPAFMLYTSATGNTPVSGIVICHLALLQQHLTAKWVLDLKDEDTYWCTADPGWVTGIVYGILAPWSLGITQVAYEGRFSAEKWYTIIDKYHVSVLYTAPTALRMLEKEESELKKANLTSLRHLASVGEALPSSVVEWVKKNFKVPILDTWWQTETGAMMITNYLSIPIKPGSMGKPIPGINAQILDDKMKPLKSKKEGNLAFKLGWPAMMIDIFKNKKLFKSYFKNGWFISGDRAYKDRQGYFWFIGRKSEIIKTAGERVGTFEVESVISSYPQVLECAVIGKPDKLRGEIIKAFIVLKKDFKPSEKLKEDIVVHVKRYLAGHAYPREIEFVKSLPKNRSGKIMRRLLKAKELGLPVGDTSTLEED